MVKPKKRTLEDTVPTLDQVAVDVENAFSFATLRSFFLSDIIIGGVIAGGLQIIYDVYIDGMKPISQVALPDIVAGVFVNALAQTDEMAITSNNGSGTSDDVMIRKFALGFGIRSIYEMLLFYSAGAPMNWKEIAVLSLFSGIGAGTSAKIHTYLMSMTNGMKATPTSDTSYSNVPNNSM